MLAYFTVYNFGRVKLLVWGHLAMGLFWGGIGFSTMYEYNMIAMILIVGFLITYAVTEGAVIFIYCAEALNDTQLGIGVLGLWVN